MNSSTINNNFKFFVPLEDFKKGTDKSGVEVMKVKGLASTGTQDADGEFLDPSGFDLSAFAYVNWNHEKGPGAFIGEPTNWSITPDGQFFIEADLYPEVDEAKKVWNLGRALAKSKRGNQLGFSVEGKVIERDLVNPSRVKKAKITAVAICPHPKNSDTFCDFITKGFTSEEEWEYELEKGSTEGEVILDVIGENGDRFIVDKNYQLRVVKAMSAEGQVGEDITLEDLEGSTTNKKKSKKNKKKSEKDIIFKAEFNKSQIFDEIFTRVQDIQIVTAKKIFNLINTMAKDQPVTIDSINKAFEFLEKLEKADTANGGLETSLTGAVDMAKACRIKGMSSEETDSELEKAGYDSEIIKKAKEIDALDTDEDDEKEKKEEKVEKSAKEVELEKAIETAKILREEVAAEKFQKSHVTNPSPENTFDTTEIYKALETNKSEVNDLIKKGFDSVKKIVTDLVTENTELRKSFDEVGQRLKIVEDTPLGKRSVTTKNFLQNQENINGDGIQKSEGSGVVLNISNRNDKTRLIKALAGTVDWRESSSSEDLRFMAELQAFENGVPMSNSILKKANELGYRLVK